MGSTTGVTDTAIMGPGMSIILHRMEKGNGRRHVLGRLGLLTGCLLMLGFSGAHSQADQSGLLLGIPRGTTTNFLFAQPNELTIVVNLLGAVQRPGRYEISRTIDLMNLLSLAGGTSERANLTDVRIMRTVKTDSGSARVELRMNLDNPSKVNEADLTLHQGDFIYIGLSSAITVQEVLSYLTTAAVLTTAIVTVINQSRN